MSPAQHQEWPSGSFALWIGPVAPGQDEQPRLLPARPMSVVAVPETLVRCCIPCHYCHQVHRQRPLAAPQDGLESWCFGGGCPPRRPSLETVPELVATRALNWTLTRESLPAWCQAEGCRCSARPEPPEHAGLRGHEDDPGAQVSRAHPGGIPTGLRFAHCC